MSPVEPQEQNDRDTRNVTAEETVRDAGDEAAENAGPETPSDAEPIPPMGEEEEPLDEQGEQRFYPDAAIVGRQINRMETEEEKRERIRREAMEEAEEEKKEILERLEAQKKNRSKESKPEKAGEKRQEEEAESEEEGNTEEEEEEVDTRKAGAKEKSGSGPGGEEEIPEFDPEKVVQQFAEEFGEETANAVKPLVDAVSRLTDIARRTKMQAEQERQAAVAMRVHALFDQAADEIDGLDTVIGNARKGALTEEQIRAREQLLDSAAMYVSKQQSRGRQVSDIEAIRKVAPLIFDLPLSAPRDRIQRSLEHRQASRTIRPSSRVGVSGRAASVYQPASGTSGEDVENVVFDEDTQYMKQVRNHIRNMGF